MRKKIYYKIADIVICVEFPFTYYAEKSYMYQFLINPVKKPDYYIEFIKTNNIVSFMEKAPISVGHVAKYHYYRDVEGKEYCFHDNGEYYHAVTVIEEKKGICYYISEQWLQQQVEKGYYLENFFCLEKIFSLFQCMILHSCHIHYKDNAILFSAPSGTGKSTQGNLWKLYAGADIINGDRTAIRKKDGIWFAYGLPFCGTSQIHQNKQAPIKAIVVLRQAKYNQVQRLTGKSAFYAIYSELTVNNWNAVFTNRAIEWTMDLINEIPIYLFECTKEAESVEVLRNYIMEGKENV